MNQDEEHLKLLSIFHYVVGGMGALFSLFPIFHLVLGLVLVVAPEKFQDKGGPPPAFMGWFFVFLAGAFILVGLSLAGCVISTARFLARRKHYTFCLVTAGVECLLLPFGTVLGVFTIVVLMRDSVKRLFGVIPSSDPPPPQPPLASHQ